MKKMNKVFSLLLAVAMMFSLVTVNVAAAGGTVTAQLDASKATVLAGQQFTVDFNVTENTGFTNLKAKYTYDKAKLELIDTDNQDKGLFTGANHNGTSTLVWQNGTIKTDITATGVAATLTFKVKSDAALGDIEITAEFDTDNCDNYAGTGVTGTIQKATVKIIEETNITSITAGTAAVPFGATADEVKAALPTTLKGSGATTGGTTVTDMDLEVDSWALPTDMDTVGGTTFEATATMKTVAGVNISEAAKAQAKATVTLTKLTTGTIDIADTIEIPVKKVDDVATEQNAEAVAAAVKEKFGGKVTVKGSNAQITAEFVPTIVAAAAVTNIDDTTTATVTVSGEAGKFNISEASPLTKTVTVKVIPDTITDGSVKWEMNAVVSANTDIKVNITYTATEAGKEAVVTVSNGTTTKTVTLALPALEEGKTEGSATIPVGKLKTLFGAAPNAGDQYTFDVKVGGAAVAYEPKTEDAEAVMDNQITIANSSSGSSGVSGLPGATTSNKKTYNIVVEESENGTATAPEKAAKGDKVTVTTTPAEGFKTDVITVKTSKGINVPVTDKSFTMPDASVTITVTFVEGEEPVDSTTPSADLFADVPADHWAYAFIKEMKELGIVNGVSNTEFAPDANITRAEFAKMVAQAFGLTATATECAFTDCTADDWYTPYVIAGVEAGILNGVSATEFGADQQITRQDICAVLGRILDAENSMSAAADSSFTDIDQVADYAVVAVKAFVAAGIVNGYEDGSFRPTAYASRAEVCKILSNVLKLVADEAEAELEEEIEAGVGEEIEAEIEAEAGAEAEVEEEVVDTIDVEPEK